MVAAAAICALAAALIFVNLDRSLLWQDEAQTALLARTTLQHGYPVGHDGVNSLSQEEGKDVDAHDVFRYHPWVQFYLAAGSFALFGESTTTARLPFALLGVATVLLTFHVARSIWKTTEAAAASALLLTLSVPFLLLVRQCRYYSPLAFFLLLAVFAYLQVLRDRKGAMALMIAATLLTMHTFHLYALVFLAACCLHTLIWHRGKWKQVLIPAALIVLIHVPWFMWVLAVAQYNHAQTAGAIAAFTVWYLMQAAGYVVTPVTIFGGLVLFAQRKKPKLGVVALDEQQRTAIYFLLILIGVAVVCMGLRAPWTFFRYLAPLPPIGALLFGPVIPMLAARDRLWGMAAAGATLLWLAVGGSLLQYPYELLTPFRGPARGMVEYLNANASAGDIVVLPYGDMPLKFYTNLRVVGGLTGEDLEAGRTARFLIPRKHQPSAACARVTQFMASIANKRDYEPVPLPYPDLMCENREDLASHVFGPPAEKQGVVIIKRRDAAK